jgi:hypothetical protein
MIYDLDRCPPTFDALSAAMRFERLRIECGAESFAIDVLPGRDRGFAGNELWPHDHAERIRLRDHVGLPILRMNPRCERATLRERRSGDPAPEYICGFSEFVAAYRAGIRPLRPSTDLAHDPALVTITLRECQHWPQRNSRIDAWLLAARILAREGWRVVIVRDTARAGDALLAPFASDIDAAFSLEARATLYRSAFCNIFVNNGPAWLAFALDAPAVVLKLTTEGAGRSHGADHWRRIGVRPGEQLPGAPSYQRLFWRDDRAEDIVRAFVEFHAINAEGGGHESQIHGELRLAADSKIHNSV